MMGLAAFIIAISALSCIAGVMRWRYNRAVRRHKKNVDELLGLPEDQRAANWERIFRGYKEIKQ